MVDFNIQTGKAKTVTGRRMSFDTVASLVNKQYLGSGYHIYYVNFYTSPALFRHLCDFGFGACGTYREGQLGTPTTMVNALTRKFQRGSIWWTRDWQLLFEKWMDTREVSVCSTVNTAYSEETVMRGRKTCDGYERVAVPRPTGVAKQATEGHKKCKVRERNTPFMCKAYRVPLCVIVDRNCHDNYHVNTQHLHKLNYQ